MRLIQITSGRGPAECRWVVEQFLGKLIKEVDTLGMTLEVIEVYGDYDSVLLSISGDRTDNYIKTIAGTIQWIEKSPLRPHHKRNNWYIGVNVLPNPENMPELDVKHLKFTTMRASGPGGQHVNKTETAVRVTHIPTGLTATSEEERSQLMNKKTAVLKLVKMLSDRTEAESAKADKVKWDIHNNLERGNAIRVYRAGKLEVK